MSLTARQQEVFAFIQKYITAEGYPPSRAEIGAALGISSNAVQQNLCLIARKGAIELLPKISRGIRIKKD